MCIRDSPTGATILGRRGIEEAYRTGRGKIRVRAVTNIETLPNGKSTHHRSQHPSACTGESDEHRPRAQAHPAHYERIESIIATR